MKAKESRRGAAAAAHAHRMLLKVFVFMSVMLLKVFVFISVVLLKVFISVMLLKVFVFISVMLLKAFMFISVMLLKVFIFISGVLLKVFILGPVMSVVAMKSIEKRRKTKVTRAMKTRAAMTAVDLELTVRVNALLRRPLMCLMALRAQADRPSGSIPSARAA